MGISGISPWSLILVLAIVVVLFGTKRLRNMGKDLGHAVKGFKDGVNESTAVDVDENGNPKKPDDAA